MNGESRVLINSGVSYTRATRCSRLIGFCAGDKSARMYISASADKREKSKEREIVSVFIMFCVRRQALDNTPDMNTHIKMS